jgi:hypothetical protein
MPHSTVLLFVRANMQDVVRHLSIDETRGSLEVRPVQVRDAIISRSRSPSEAFSSISASAILSSGIGSIPQFG